MHSELSGAAQGNVSWTDQDASFMKRALELAERGRGTVSPNPLVGCVIVKDGVAIGEGWHERAGEAHAEVRALAAASGVTPDDAAEAARGATAYVSLEPCSHTGRTGPCTEALIEAGVSRVVVASLDPNPVVNGRGLERLRSHGVEVEFGLMRAAAETQNEVFRTAQLLRRPFVLYKTAMSLDGKIAVRTGRSRWITGPAARARVHEWRAELDAVVVGVNTLLLDDPSLTAREPVGRTPLKVIFDSVARTPPTAKLFDVDDAGVPARVVIYCTSEAPQSRVAALESAGATVVRASSERGRPIVAAALTDLLQRGVTSVLLEGGGTLAWDFFAHGFVDKVAWFIAPKLLGGTAAGPLGGVGVASVAEAFELQDVVTESVGSDLLVTGRVIGARAPSEQAADMEEVE